jgi:hypothetical protein
MVDPLHKLATSGTKAKLWPGSPSETIRKEAELPVIASEVTTARMIWHLKEPGRER